MKGTNVPKPTEPKYKKKPKIFLPIVKINQKATVETWNTEAHMSWTIFRNSPFSLRHTHNEIRNGSSCCLWHCKHNIWIDVTQHTHFCPRLTVGKIRLIAARNHTWKFIAEFKQMIKSCLHFVNNSCDFGRDATSITRCIRSCTWQMKCIWAARNGSVENDQNKKSYAENKEFSATKICSSSSNDIHQTAITIIWNFPS